MLSARASCFGPSVHLRGHAGGRRFFFDFISKNKKHGVQKKIVPAEPSLTGLFARAWNLLLKNVFQLSSASSFDPAWSQQKWIHVRALTGYVLTTPHFGDRCLCFSCCMVGWGCVCLVRAGWLGLVSSGWPGGMSSCPAPGSPVGWLSRWPAPLPAGPGLNVVFFGRHDGMTKIVSKIHNISQAGQPINIIN